jgi:hypothetical protein
MNIDQFIYYGFLPSHHRIWRSISKRFQSTVGFGWPYGPFVVGLCFLFGTPVVYKYIPGLMGCFEKSSLILTLFSTNTIFLSYISIIPGEGPVIRMVLCTFFFGFGMVYQYHTFHILMDFPQETSEKKIWCSCLLVLWPWLAVQFLEVPAQVDCYEKTSLLFSLISMVIEDAYYAVIEYYENAID